MAEQDEVRLPEGDHLEENYRALVASGGASWDEIERRAGEGSTLAAWAAQERAKAGGVDEAPRARRSSKSGAATAAPDDEIGG